ncbi:hypothetical protein Sulac_1228 [Sulfobacillus acidophilus DSM 10332]|uniref:Uncharacterized protein n=1 Tax=Sulfobacillus acidophilus (strain ATCC 700253 / DSM 10332 / NAL) TaxID=679936 RepID=G8TV88_SULAD|nr:hypothetical protein Sulac_1228 [Sulfobacillus acidophilus DSM 10332]
MVQALRNLAIRGYAAWIARTDTRGEGHTGSNIIWIIAVIVLGGVILGFVAGAGTAWMHNNFNTVTQMNPGSNVTTTG